MSKHWQRLPLGEVAPARSLSIPAANTGVWNLSLEDIESNTGRVLVKKTCRVDELGSAKCVFDQGHVLYSKLRPYLNKVVVPDSAGVGTSELIPLRPNERLDREFLAFYLRSPTFLDFAKANTRGANLPRIAMAELWEHRIPVPSTLTEQCRIVARIKECLARVDEVGRLACQVYEESIHLPQAFRFDLWQECLERYPLVELGTLVSSAKNGLYKPREHHGSGSILLRMFNINGTEFDTTRLERLNVTEKEANDYSIWNGDIIVSRVNSRDLVGKSAVVAGLAETAVFEAMLIRLRIDAQKARQDILAWLMNAPQFLHDLRMRAKHAIGQSSINQQDLLGSRVPLPPLDKQLLIAEKYADLGDLAANLRLECGDRSQPAGGLREAILRKAFAGEL
jgi:type I restriction enzyme, S subunit